VYLNFRLLVPRMLRRGSFLLYLTALLASIAGITFGVVILIQLLYDYLWGPDFRRFSWWTNVGYDYAWIAGHVALAAVFIKFWQQWVSSRIRA
jgi:hypothetical protein